MAGHLLLLPLLFILMSTEGLGQDVVSPPALYVFGDSLADVGNNNHLLTLLKANFPHNGVDFDGGKPTGRFSNGKNAADFLAEKLCLPLTPPYLAIKSRPELFFKGINFASGGAGILDTTNKGDCLSLNMQINFFSKAYTSMMELVGVDQLQIQLSNSIFAFIIGSNDIFAYLSKGKATPQEFMGSLVSNLQLQLQKLYNFGARKFVFIGTGPLGCIPAQRRETRNENCNDRANTISDIYNKATVYLLKEIQSQLGDFSFSFFNTSLSFQLIFQNAVNYGFTEVKVACCGLGDLNAKVACTPISSLCPDRSNHFFWDAYHPTEAATSIFVDEIVDGTSPLVYPLNARQLAAL